MGLRVPWPAEKMDISGAGHNGNGEFILSNGNSEVVRVPEEWRVPLAAHLLEGTTLFDPGSSRALREIEQKIRKKRKLSTTDADALAGVAHALECLLNEYLEADPRTSTRYEYRPAYYDETVKKVLEMRVGWGPPPAPPPPPPPGEENDPTPMPWE